MMRPFYRYLQGKRSLFASVLKQCAPWITQLIFLTSHAHGQPPVDLYCETIQGVPLEASFSSPEKMNVVTRSYLNQIFSSIKNRSKSFYWWSPDTETNEQIESISSLPESPIYKIMKNSFPTQPQRREILFPNLSLQQFQSLKAKFGMELSVLKYSPNIIYRLQDFFPPNLQAALELSEYSNC
ncbi:MAG: hypothetical protein JNM39_00595 [Bdellovibrionaceae bacterium]|nr:hypothetical protein [Pseudobdellovibrionaceae bacterium]